MALAVVNIVHPTYTSYGLGCELFRHSGAPGWTAQNRRGTHFVFCASERAPQIADDLGLAISDLRSIRFSVSPHHTPTPFTLYHFP